MGRRFSSNNPVRPTHLLHPWHNVGGVLQGAEFAKNRAQDIVAEIDRDRDDRAEIVERAKRQEEAKERAKKEVEERAKKEAEKRAKKEAEKRAKKEAEKRAKKEAEERERAEREAEERAKERAEKERAEKESFFCNLSSTLLGFTSMLLQKKDSKPSMPPTRYPSPAPFSISIKHSEAIVNEGLILDFINKSNPQNLFDLGRYIKACDFIRQDRSIGVESKNFKAFKEQLQEELKNIQNPREEGQVKAVLKRAEDVYKLNDKEYDNYKAQMEFNAIKANREAQEEAKRKAQEEERRRAQKKSQENKTFSAQPLIQLTRNEPRWSKEEIESMSASEYYARLQVKTGTSFSEKGHPGKDRINCRGFLRGNFTKRVYSPENPPHHMSKEGIGFNHNSLLELLPTKPTREDANSSYIWSLQNKFDKSNNFDINASVNPQTPNKYISSRVAEWERESSQFKIDKKTTNPKNLKDYCEYLIENIGALKAKEIDKESDAEIDKSKLKTLIAFQYLELGKIIYAGTWGNQIGALDRSDDSSTQKSSIIGEILITVPEQYQSYLQFRSRGVYLETFNSISLPNLDPLNSSQDKEYRHYLETLANSGTIQSAYVPTTDKGAGFINYTKHGRMRENQEMIENPGEFARGYIEEKVADWPDLNIMRSLDVMSKKAHELTQAFKAGKDGFSQRVSVIAQWVEKRAEPATIKVSPNTTINKDNGLGYCNPNPDAKEHDRRRRDSRVTRYSEITGHGKGGNGR
jgi:hypothetical protein